MGLLDKLITAGGVILVGAVGKTLYRDAQETTRRKNSPLCFGESLTQDAFVELSRAIGKRTPRVENVTVTGMTVTLHVGSLSGLSRWGAQIDFNDYGHLTGTYWLNSDNSDSLVPEHFAKAMQAEIQRRVGRTARGR